MDRARNILDKKRAEIHQRIDEHHNGPQGEKRSEFSNQCLELVNVDLIREDPTFQNLRQVTNDDDMLELTESIKFEGLKVPIKIIEGNRDREYFFVRAGFRRLKVVQLLKWKKIPAIILPYNTPEKEEYWTNIIENSARSRLTTYEIANAARAMRGRFHVTPREFALRAGYSESYVINLLRCIDRLPEEILSEWEGRAPIPTTLLMDWAKMEHTEAIKMMLVYKNRHERITKGWTPSPEAKARVSILRMASATGIKRMQRARFAIEVARSLDPKTRELALKIIDFCTGARNDIPGIHDAEEKRRMYKSRRREDREFEGVSGDKLPDLPVQE